MATSLQSTTQETIDVFQQYVIGNYTRFPVCLVRGEGSEVWDAEGNRYLDLFPGWGCNLIGHCPPRVVEAVREQVGTLIHVPNTWYMEPQGNFAKALVERAFESKVFFCNSGTEANEAAIKLARAHQAPRYKILATEGSFHGRTFASISATGQPKYQQGFGPLLPGFRHVPFGKIDAMANAIDEEMAAILVEPIQGEGGVRVPPAGYLADLRQLADEHHLLLLFDEVQTGMGRTGEWFAFQHEAGIEPDILTLAKALAGGVACGAMLAKPEVAASLRPGLHAATFGGNPIACRAGIATVETIEEEGLIERGREIGKQFEQAFIAMRAKLPIIEEIRIRGTMIGVELSVSATPVVQAALSRRLLINATHDTVVRLLPALNITNEQIAEGCSILESILTELAG